ncbi:MAG TPA: hypothetical protein VHF51_16410 [Solirubrobacteraceae bacterium]|nr:hypothetical protein [Solirubrobacteraceae bacterium]
MTISSTARGRNARRLAAATALTAVLLGAPAAAAAAPWGPPQVPPGSPASAPALTFGSPGVGVLVGQAGDGGTVGAQSTTNLDTFLPFRPLTAADFPLTDDVATYATTRLVGLGTRIGHPTDRAGLVFGQVGTKLTDVRLVGPTDRAGRARALDVNDRGDTAATYGVCANRACVLQALYLVVRRAGRSPGGLIRIDNRAVRQLSTVTVNQRGDVLVAWQADRGVYARIRTAGGTLYRTQRLGNPGQPVNAISAVLTANRAAAVAWEAQSASEGVPGSPATVDAAFKAAGARHRFHSAQRLATVPALRTGHYVAERRVRVVEAADGAIHAAWTSYVNGRFVVQTGTLRGFRFGAVQTVSDPAMDAVLADLDAGPSAELAIAFRTGVAGADPGTGPAGLRAALRAPGAAAFGPAETILENADTPVEATLRFDPATARPVAAWRSLRANAITTSAREPLVLPRNGRRF